jgi:hypothetical protein
MKAISLILLMLGCAAWPVRAAYAGQSVAASRQEHTPNAAETHGNHSREADHAAEAGGARHVGRPSDDLQNQRKISGHKASVGTASPSKANQGNEAANSRERSGSQDSRNSRRAGSIKSAGAAQNGLARNETNNHAASNRSPTAVRPAAPAISNVRHHGANPAIIGGAGNSNSRNTMALDGKQMNRNHTGN